MSRRRQLSDDEQALWTDVARSITPLRRSRKVARPPAEPALSPPAKPSAKLSAPQPKSPTAALRRAPPSAQAPPLAPLVPLGRRSKQRIARGREPIDGRLDLHGMTQSQAHAALLHFLHRAQAADARTVLVVTGKGSGKALDARDASVERGVLRRQVPLWLTLPEFRPLIVAFDDAHVGHGGQGALYVRLRRRK